MPMTLVRARQEATMTRTASEHGTRRSFSVIQVLIVFAIVGVFAGIAIPVYASRAKDSVLRQNADSLALQVRSYLALDLDPAYIADADKAPGADQDDVSTTLAAALRSGTAGRYLNPCSGSRTVLCQSEPPTSASGARPAVWITDDPHYAYAQITPSIVTRDQLAGTLLVVFVAQGTTQTIDVFYVNAAGGRSALATALAL
jgi:type II secretory pathway pseudopilin PulG